MINNRVSFLYYAGETGKFEIPDGYFPRFLCIFFVKSKRNEKRMCIYDFSHLRTYDSQEWTIDNLMGCAKPFPCGEGCSL